MSQPTDPTQLRDRLAEALRTTPSVLMDTPEERARHATTPRNHHGGDHYYWGCAMCRGEVDTLADAVHGVVQAELDAKDAEITRLIAFLERGFDTHMQFGVIAADGTTEMLPCADWCYACKLEAANAERDRAMAGVPLVCADDRHQAKVRGLEAELAEARDEIERLNTDLAGWELYYDGPPPRAIDSTPDISDYQEAQP